ncbi:MAG: ATP-binding protein [Clostridia bacterium]|nr:ATP-binding protein [Clostridia bacterium]
MQIYKDKAQALFLLILLIILLSSVYISYISPGKIQPSAKKGVLDLSDWNFEKNGNVMLNGEWEFYWDKLLTPEYFNLPHGINPDGYAVVPSSWHNNAGSVPRSQKGKATYRLKVVIPEGMKKFGIKTKNIRMSSIMYINGMEAGNNGKPANSRKEYIMLNKPYSSYFFASSNTMEIIVQVANYDYKSGGIIQPIFLGKQEDIAILTFRNSFVEIFVVACFFISGIYYLGVYLGNKKQKGVLYLGIYALLFSYYVFTDGEKSIYHIFPSVSFEAVMKTKQIAVNITIILICFFIDSLYKKLVPKKLLQLTLALFGGHSILAALLPFRIYSRLEGAFFLFGMLEYLFLIIAVLNASFKQNLEPSDKNELLYLAAGFICVEITFIDQLVYLYGLKRDSMTGHLSFVLFMLIITQMLSKRYTNAFKTIESMSARLMELDRLKDEFLVNTSHELKTPLNGIINLTRSMLEKKPANLTNQQQNDLNLVIQAGKRLNSLVNDILDMARLKRGELKLNKVPIDVRTVVDVVIRFVDYLKQDKEIEVINSIPSNLPPAYADKDRIRQIYYNLLSNALKFTQKGEIVAGGRENGDFLELWVEDTGCGIPSDKHEEIFKPFYQLDTIDTKENSGTGLGLSITRNLIELHGGRIRVESVLGKGSKFCFTLPCSKNSKPVDIFEDYALEYTSKPVESKSAFVNEKEKDVKYKILAVEDDTTNLRTLLSTIEAEDYFIKAVHDGQAAINELYGYRKFDLVILDIMLPKVSGFDVLKKIRERFLPVELPVLLLTAKSRAEDIKTGFELGANDFIAKPFEAEELKSRVRTLVQLKSAVNSIVLKELSFLQAQIKPHFIYNALSVISSLINKSPVTAKNLIIRLSDYLRGSFNFENHDGLISIETELKTVEAYLSIEKARFAQRLNVVYDIDTDIVASIPILSIQPLVENAVRHGILGKEEGGTVKLSIKGFSDRIIIVVEDDGAGIKPDILSRLLATESEGSGVGIRNIHKRLLALYGKGLAIESDPGKGTKVTIEIPVIKG